MSVGLQIRGGGGQAEIFWASSAPLVEIGLTETPSPPFNDISEIGTLISLINMEVGINVVEVQKLQNQ